MKSFRLFHMIIVFILVFALVLFVSSSYATRADAPSSWAKADVDRAVSLGLVPDSLQSRYTDSVTREEFCAIAVNIYEVATGKVINIKRSFDDTNDVNVQKMGGLKIVSGAGDNSFLPKALLTREQAAVILSKLAESMGIQLGSRLIEFSDNNDISDWAFAAICGVNEPGIMRGTGNNLFEPKGAYTIEQSIISSLRVYDLGASKRLVEIAEENVPLARFTVSEEETAELQKYADEVVEFINAERVNAGASPIYPAEILTIAANIRVAELEELYSHDRPDGRQYITVFTDLGITYGLRGENLGKGYKNSEDCVKGWMNSATHRENLLNEEYGRLGIGVHRDSEGVMYWALLLAD